MGLQLLSKLLLVFVILQSYQASPLQESKNRKDGLGKVKPMSYDLIIQPFPEEEVYIGKVVINVLTLEKTNVISLNAHENVTIEKIKLTVLNHGSAPKTPIDEQKIDKIEETNLVNITLGLFLERGEEFNIAITFSGKINTHDTNGLFKKTYVDADTKQTKWIIASQFKPNYTHVVFPYFDNPSYRVPIDVTIQRPANLNSLSTMPLSESIDTEKDWVKDVFCTTPPMSVSSLAIFVSDLKPFSVDKPELQLQILPESGQNRKDLIYKAHVAFKEFFGVKYPLPKLDYIVLPSSAGLNVYSNWGLVISSNNIFDEEQADSFIELSNQWAGNIVTSLKNTPDEANIDQGFTYFVNDYLRNLEKGDKKFLYYYYNSDLQADYYGLADAIPRDDPDIRRSIETTKVMLVFKMLLSTLTEQTFTNTLKTFIQQREFKTFEWDEFWDALSEQAHADKTLPTNMSVKKIATYWLNNHRLPYVTATRDYNTNSVLLKQNLFIRKRPYSAVSDKDKHLVWTIPIVLQAQDTLNFTNLKPMHWMQTQEYNLHSIADSKQFIIINPEEIAPYMVNYDNTNWNMLANFLQSAQLRPKIPLVTRAKLIHDALNLAYAGTLDFGTALNITVYLKDETHHIPWRPFFNLYDHIGRHIGGTAAFKKFEIYASLLLKPLYEHLKTKTNPDQQTKLFINEVKIILRDTGDKPLLKDANTAYEKWMKNPNDGYKDIEPYLCSIYEHGSQKQWEFGITTLQNLGGKPDIDRIYLFKCVVGCTKDPVKIKQFLNMTLFEQNNVFTDDDFEYACFMLTGGAEGFMATYEYLQQNWNVLKIRLQDKPKIWKQLIYTATNLHKTQAGLDHVSALYTQRRGQFGAAEETITKALSKIKEEVQWTNHNMKNLEHWLDNYILKNSKK